MWIDDAKYNGKEVTWGTNNNIATILDEAMRYANKNRWSIVGISTHIGINYDDKLVTVEFE